MAVARRQFSREFKLEAVKLVEERGVSVRQAAQDLDVHENVLRKWVCELREQPEEAFPGNGKMTARDAEVARLRKEVAKLKMERDLLKKPRPTSRRSRFEVRLHCEAPRSLAGQFDVRGARCLEGRFLCLADRSAKP
jgi:transposase